MGKQPKISSGRCNQDLANKQKDVIRLDSNNVIYEATEDLNIGDSIMLITTRQAGKTYIVHTVQKTLPYMMSSGFLLCSVNEGETISKFDILPSGARD